MNKGIRFTDEFTQDAVAQVVERTLPPPNSFWLASSVLSGLTVVSAIE
jgi:hypothetical protein